MKKLATTILFLFLVFLVALFGARFSCVLFTNARPSHQDAHEWIHTQLGITAGQNTKLDAIEARYHGKRENLEQALSQANRELAQEIRSGGKDPERVNAAIAKLHSKMGELQMLTIQHILEMKEALSPEQYQKLLNLTADALDSLDSQHGRE